MPRLPPAGSSDVSCVRFDSSPSRPLSPLLDCRPELPVHPNRATSRARGSRSSPTSQRFEKRRLLYCGRRVFENRVCVLPVDLMSPSSFDRSIANSFVGIICRMKSSLA